ncbi:MAG TPA: phosphatase PAP2 family protein [Terriglobales bacterium]|nr:phosphatase PAP2 family protein [Terriglobales bacterium]
MAWETWTTSDPARKVLWISCSLVLIALFIVAAWALDLSVPYLPLAVAGGMVFYLRNWPSVQELIAWIVASHAFALIVHFPHDHNWINTGAGVMSLFGLGAFLMLGLRWLWSTGAERRKTYAVLAPGAAMVLFVLSAQRALSLANVLYAKTFDLYLYVVDGSFGFQPSFLMGRAMATSSVLRVACLLTYISLPFVMALVYALRLPKGTERPSWDIITLFLLAGLGGWALYNVVPATGPVYVFADSFPWRALPYKSLPRLFLELVPVNSGIPRNAIPSLHMAWAMLLFWNTKGRSRGLRIFLAVYAGMTVVSTLGTGEHYFVDLVAGVPFALAVQAVVSPDGKASFSRRAMAAGAGLALTMGWLLLARFGAKAMLVSPILPWSLVAASGVAVWRIKVWLDLVLNAASELANTAQRNVLASSAHG